METLVSDQLYHTAELRWFVSAEAGWDQLLRWFRLDDLLPLREEGWNEPTASSQPFVKLEQTRTDVYLILPKVETAGVKQRQGRLEVKALVAGPHPFSLGTVAGRIEQWVKWTFQASPAIAAPLEAELGQTGPWREVAKKRYLQQVVFDTGRPVAVSPDLCPGAGCHVELTLVNLIETFSAWFTVGFEAFGPPDQALALLDAAVRHFFATHGSPPVQLDSRASLSYPAWLATLP
jgi:hypothetical protein